VSITQEGLRAWIDGAWPLQPPLPERRCSLRVRANARMLLDLLRKIA
jgi:hypothetical protein